MDLQNVLFSVYEPNLALQIVNNPFTLAIELLEYVYEWLKLTAETIPDHCTVWLFWSEGEPLLQRSIYKGYKEQRGPYCKAIFEKELGDRAADIQKELSTIVHTVLNEVADTINQIDSLYMVKLNYCDADLIPYLVMTEFNDHLVQTSNNQYNLIVSADRDFVQLIQHDTLQYCGDQIVDELHNTWCRLFVKDTDTQLPPYYIVPFKAISGDPSDNIKGVRGMGKKRTLAFLNEVYTKTNHRSRITVDDIERLLDPFKVYSVSETFVERMKESLDDIRTYWQIVDLSIISKKSPEPRRSLHEQLNRMNKTVDRRDLRFLTGLIEGVRNAKPD